MRATSRPHPVLRDLAVAAAAIVVVASLVFTAGRWFLRGFAMPSLAEATEGRELTVEQWQAVQRFDLNSALGGTSGAVAALDATGSLTGRFTFTAVDTLTVVEADGGTIEMSARVRGGTSVLLVAGTVAPGERATAGFSVTVSMPGITFNGGPDQCVLTIDAADARATSVRGWVACEAVPEMRSGAPASFIAVFHLG